MICCRLLRTYIVELFQNVVVKTNNNKIISIVLKYIGPILINVGAILLNMGYLTRYQMQGFY